jgi:PEP-CTERM putative exosortase interaction domain
MKRQESPSATVGEYFKQFVQQRVSNRDAFAGFGIRINGANWWDYGSFNLGGTSDFDRPTLTITTADVPEPVPEPIAIFGSALGLSLGGWLKRKNSSRPNKTTPQH